MYLCRCVERWRGRGRGSSSIHLNHLSRGKTKRKIGKGKQIDSLYTLSIFSHSFVWSNTHTHTRARAPTRTHTLLTHTSSHFPSISFSLFLLALFSPPPRSLYPWMYQLNESPGDHSVYYYHGNRWYFIRFYGWLACRVISVKYTSPSQRRLNM